MANESAWNLGAEIASKNIAARRARKEALTDEERQLHVNTLYSKGSALAKVIPSLTGEHRDRAMKDLIDVEQGIAEIYHPDRNPGALQKDWHMLAGLIHKSRPAPVVPTSINYDLTRTPDTTFTPAAQSVMLGATPGYPVLGALPPEAGATLPRAKLAGIEAGTPGQDIALPSTPVTIPGTTTPSVRPAAASMTPQQRQMMARRDAARRQAELDVAGGMSPEEEAQADSAKKLAYVRQAQKDYESLNPNATSEQKASFLANLVQKTYEFAQRPVWKEFTGPDGQKDWLDVTQPVPAGWTATGTESADTRKRADYAAFLKTNPDYESNGGSFEQWTVERGQLAKLAVPTSRDDRYIALQQKLAEGQKLDPKEQAYVDGYDMYVKKRITGPMLARVAAQAADRYMPFVSADDPEKVIMMPVAEAARAGLGTPQSAQFKTLVAMDKYMTSGKGGENINYFNTAVDHLDQLYEASDELNNGALQVSNKWRQKYAAATGDPAPTNFETVKSAVAGELSKTFKGTGATDAEIAQINAEINLAESPAQLHGAINHYRSLMRGKLTSLKYQYEQGKQGKPAFTPAPGEGGGGGGGATDMITMQVTDATGTHTGTIHRSQKEQFIKDHKGAVEVTSGAK